MTKIVFCLVFSVLSPALAKAAGTSGAQFLKISPGARPVAMGEAFTGVADDINAIYWNPAGLTAVKSQVETMFTHTIWFESISLNNAAYIQRVGKRTVIGGLATHLTTGQVPKYDRLGGRAGDSYGASDLMTSITLARLVDEKVSVGLNGKFIQQRLDGESAVSWAIDVGLMYRQRPNFRFGGSINNLGTFSRFRDKSNLLPLTVKLGLAYYWLKSLTLALDANMPNDNNTYFNFGMEYANHRCDWMALRLGYKTISARDLGGLAGFAAGFGLFIAKMPEKLCEFDYSWVPYGELGETHRFSLIFKWN